MQPAFFIALWLLVNVFLVGAYDVFAAFFLTPDETVSFWLQQWFKRLPVMAVAVGIVIGHLAWPIGSVILQKGLPHGDGGNPGP